MNENLRLEVGAGLGTVVGSASEALVEPAGGKAVAIHWQTMLALLATPRTSRKFVHALKTQTWAMDWRVAVWLH
jgi:hypothetical protein